MCKTCEDPSWKQNSPDSFRVRTPLSEESRSGQAGILLRIDSCHNRVEAAMNCDAVHLRPLPMTGLCPLRGGIYITLAVSFIKKGAAGNWSLSAFAFMSVIIHGLHGKSNVIVYNNTLFRAIFLWPLIKAARKTAANAGLARAFADIWRRPLAVCCVRKHDSFPVSLKMTENK